MLAVLQMILTTHSFHWKNTPVHKQAFIDDSRANIGSDIHDRPAQYEHSRLSLRLQAALSLRETTDVIRETVLLSQIAGHYVKDIRHKGAYTVWLCNEIRCTVVRKQLSYK